MHLDEAEVARLGAVIDELAFEIAGRREAACDGTGLWLGVGSDHTDRALEAHSVALSKQVCPKPLGAELWRWEEVRDHCDALELRSWIREAPGEDWTPYQDGTLAAVRPLPELMASSPAAEGERLQPKTLLFCGTLAAIGGVRPARFFRMELRDPVRGRAIEHSYEAVPLPVIS